MRPRTAHCAILRAPLRLAVALEHPHNRPGFAFEATMPGTTKFFLLFGAFAGMTGVMLGAFGAHALRGKLAPDLLSVYQTAVQYQFWHALALLAIGALAFHLPASAPLRWSGYAMALGILLFSGSLYALAFSGVRPLGMITPFGGITWIIGWALLAWAILRA
ncbi:MAG TPA: DUF423 domain-containing protein [Burkholderiales bacterium]|nr:DUF423 domain-containing protein [Burkholderiales bacterium]